MEIVCKSYFWKAWWIWMNDFLHWIFVKNSILFGSRTSCQNRLFLCYGIANLFYFTKTIRLKLHKTLHYSFCNSPHFHIHWRVCWWLFSLILVNPKYWTRLICHQINVSLLFLSPSKSIWIFISCNHCLHNSFFDLIWYRIIFLTISKN